MGNRSGFTSNQRDGRGVVRPRHTARRTRVPLSISAATRNGSGNLPASGCVRLPLAAPTNGVVIAPDDGSAAAGNASLTFLERDASGHECKDKEQEENCQGNEKQNLGNTGRGCRNAGKPEQTGNDRDDEKYDCPFEHADPP